MRQMTLFDVEIDTKNQKKQSDRQLIGEPKQAKMTPCVFCGVLPKVWKHETPTHGIYTNARCPECGWGCSTPYGNIEEHWNGLNTLEWRLKEKNGKGKANI